MKQGAYSINVNVNVYNPDIPSSSAGLYNLHPWYWNAIFYSLISSGENSAFAHSAANRYQSLLGRQR